MAKAKITVTAQEQGVQSVLKTVADLEKRLKQVEAALKSYDVAMKSTASTVSRVDAEVRKSHNSWLKHIATVASGIIVYQGIRSAMRGVIGLIAGGVKAVSDYQDAVIGMAAMYTTLAKDQSDIAKTYQLNVEYAKQLIPVLEKIDIYSSMNLDELLQMNQALSTQGVALNTNNQAQIQGYTNISNAIKFITKGMATSRQISQEIKAVINGQAKASDSLGKLLQSKIGPEYAKQIAQWKKMGELQGDSGFILEKIGELLSGFTPAAKDMENTWSAVVSSLKTTFNILARESMTDVLADWVKYIQEFNTYLREHKEEIAGKVKQAWNTLKGVIVSVYENFDKVKLVLEAIVAGKILTGIIALIKAFEALKMVAAALAITMGVDIVVATGGMIVAFGAVMLIIDQLADKTSWLSDRFRALANSQALFAAAAKGEVSWSDYATAGPEKAAKMIADLNAKNNNKGLGYGMDENAAISNQSKTGVGGSYKPQSLSGYTPETGGSKGGGRHGKSDLETRTSMLMKWNDELDRELKYVYALTDAREVEMKLDEYNDKLKEKGLAQLDMQSGKEGDLLLKKLARMQIEKQVGEKMRSMYDELRSAEKDWAIAQEAVNQLLKKNNITVEESNRLLNQNKEAYEKAKNPIYDIINGLKQESQTIGVYGDALEEAQFRLDVINTLKEKGYDLSMSSAQGYLAEAMALREANEAAENNVWNKMEESIINYGDTFGNVMNDVVWGAKTSFADILTDFAKMITQMIIMTQVIKPLLKGLFGGGGNYGGASADLDALLDSNSGLFAKGGAFSGGYQITPFATGGIVTKPTFFPMSKGMGLMGEAGPEAVMPLTRTSGGKLGVQSVGNSAPQNFKVVIENNSKQDLKVETATPQFNGEETVLNIVINGIAKNKMGMRDIITQGR